MGKPRNWIGLTFGRLTVVERGEDYVYGKGRTHSRYWCKCSCGNPNLVLVDSSNLRNGSVQSCGCYAAERRRVAKKLTNRYESKNDYIVGYTMKNEPFLIDHADYDVVSPYCWYKSKSGYLESRIDGRLVRMHRLILEAEKEMIVDNYDVAWSFSSRHLGALNKQDRMM